ncbi:hypothetical protein G9464_09625 [Halostella sp. JP-L12]|uniref:rod-determining factor RdfA n=1 Tax=Halostella TaxID=1843185 RepID=UPI000EF81C57|nr:MULTISPECIES: rod-determining factor RdfA [Halostella]NHN47855.1 hypothetical protein [Halostella sp. JP-L12]
MAQDDRPQSKVARLIEKYDLGSEVGDRLEADWTGTDGDRMSLRDLADRFNRRILAAAMRDADRPVIDGEAANAYRLLTDDVSGARRTEARQRLERAGVDVEAVERDFVTYQAVRSYLTEYRDAEYEGTSDEQRRENLAETVGRLRSRTTSVIESNLERLRDAGGFSLGEFRLLVSITVLCEDCDEQYGVAELLERGGCDCTE